MSHPNVYDAVINLKGTWQSDAYNLCHDGDEYYYCARMKRHSFVCNKDQFEEAKKLLGVFGTDFSGWA